MSRFSQKPDIDISPGLPICSTWPPESPEVAKVLYQLLVHEGIVMPEECPEDPMGWMLENANQFVEVHE